MKKIFILFTVISTSIFLFSCQTVTKKIDESTSKEEKKLSKWINKSEFNDINNLNFNLDKNGKTVQKTNSKLMLWKIDELISYISTFFTLKIGDVIFTGTPAGVGKVSIGDNLEGFIEDNKIFNLNIK